MSNLVTCIAFPRYISELFGIALVKISARKVKAFGPGLPSALRYEVTLNKGNSHILKLRDLDLMHYLRTHGQPVAS